MALVLTTEPLYSFVVPIKSDDYLEGTETGLFCRLKFEYTPLYPEEIPIILVEDVENLEPQDEEELTEHLQQQVIYAHILYFILLCN